MKLFTLYLFIALILISCGTTQLSVPPLPLHHKEVEYRIGIGYDFSEFNKKGFSLQFNLYQSMSDRDVFGLSFNYNVLPDHVSYVHYWLNQSQNFGGNFQLHCNPFGFAQNPRYEADVAFSQYSQNFSQSLKLGLGYIKCNGFWYDQPKKEVKGAFLPIIGYIAQLNNMQFETALYYGITNYNIEYYGSLIHSSQLKNLDELTIPHDSILSINYTTDIYKQNTGIIVVVGITGKYTINLKNSSNVTIYDYGITYGEPKVKYTLDTNYRLCGIWYEQNLTNKLFEINLNKILADYNSGKDLVIKEDSTLIAKKKSHVRFTDDIKFGFGYRWREFDK